MLAVGIRLNWPFIWEYNALNLSPICLIRWSLCTLLNWDFETVWCLSYPITPFLDNVGSRLLEHSLTHCFKYPRHICYISPIYYFQGQPRIYVKNRSHIVLYAYQLILDVSCDKLVDMLHFLIEFLTKNKFNAHMQYYSHI